MRRSGVSKVSKLCTSQSSGSFCCLRITTTIIIAPFLIYHLFSGLTLPFSNTFVSLSSCNPLHSILLVFLPAQFCLFLVLLLGQSPVNPSCPTPLSSISHPLPHRKPTHLAAAPPLHYTNPSTLAFHSHPLLHAHFAVEAHVCWQMLSLPSLAPSRRPILLPLPVSCAIRLGS